jgi:hypothetical protein
MMPSLASIDMQCTNNIEGTPLERQQLTDQLFEAIMQFSQLHTLKLRTTRTRRENNFGGNESQTSIPITASMLSSLSTRLPHLRILHFSLGNTEALTDPYFTDIDIHDSDIENLARSLPQLVSFEFYVMRSYASQIHRRVRHSKLSFASLVALGTHCRALEALSFSPGVDLRALDSTYQPLFPKLTRLNVGRETSRLSSRPAEGLSPVIAFFNFHCPKLKVIKPEGHEENYFEEHIYPPWESAYIFDLYLPTSVNGFDFMDEYDRWGYMELEQTTIFDDIEEQDEPSIWGNELFDSDERDTYSEDKYTSDSDVDSNRSDRSNCQ